MSNLVTITDRKGNSIAVERKEFDAFIQAGAAHINTLVREADATKDEAAKRSRKTIALNLTETYYKLATI
jgi:hypothetical protein